MTSAALDLIIGVWLIVYAVPVIFDQQTAGLVDVAIIVLGIAHIARPTDYRDGPKGDESNEQTGGPPSRGR
jgi:hypothetical protein